MNYVFVEFDCSVFAPKTHMTLHTQKSLNSINLNSIIMITHFQCDICDFYFQ